MRIVVNPWREANSKDGGVYPREVLYARLICLNGMDVGPDNWFEVLTHDGRIIQTELMKNQPGALTIAHQLRRAGVKIYRWQGTKLMSAEDKVMDAAFKKGRRERCC